MDVSSSYAPPPLRFEWNRLTLYPACEEYGVEHAFPENTTRE
jgi:hypothetical protein